jgi:hypothetical protein
LKETGQAHMYINENKESAYNHDVDATASPSSPCPTLFSSNPTQTDYASMISPL